MVESCIFRNYTMAGSRLGLASLCICISWYSLPGFSFYHFFFFCSDLSFIDYIKLRNNSIYCIIIYICGYLNLTLTYRHWVIEINLIIIIVNNIVIIIFIFLNFLLDQIFILMDTHSLFSIIINLFLAHFLLCNLCKYVNYFKNMIKTMIILPVVWKTYLLWANCYYWESICHSSSSHCLDNTSCNKHIDKSCTHKI